VSDLDVAEGDDASWREVLEHETGGGEELLGSTTRPVLATHVHVRCRQPRHLHTIVITSSPNQKHFKGAFTSHYFISSALVSTGLH